MPNRHHLLVPLPHGRVPGTTRGRLSVAFVPHLEGDSSPEPPEHPLTDYSADWARWPQIVNGFRGRPPLELEVLVNGTSVPANRGLTSSSNRWRTAPPDLDAWLDLFGTRAGETPIPVRPFRAVDRTDAPLAPTFDGARLAQLATAFHDELAIGYPEEPPRPGRVVNGPSFGPLRTILADYRAHLEPLGDGEEVDDDGPADWDFHQALAFVQAHPELMRVLGLVVDLEIDLPPNTDPQRVEVRSNYQSLINNQGGRALEFSGRVRTTASFWPGLPPGARGSQQFWAELDGTHSLGTIDLPSAVANAEALEGGDAEAVAPAPEAGIYVVRPGAVFSAAVGEGFERQMGLWAQIRARLMGSQSGPIDLDARDLTVGVRYDVRDGTDGRWRSLWQRTTPGGVLFTRTRRSLNLADDESWMTVTGFTEAARRVERPERPNAEFPLPPEIDTTPLRVSPVVMSWSGWSLAAPPPSKAISLVNGAEAPDPNLPPADSPLQAAIDYEVPDGVLPRLRYGRTYSVRGRLVDHAGHSRSLGEAHPEVAETHPILFGRETPLPPPVVVRRGERPIPGWGDTADTVVIRSDLDIADASVAPADRIIVPPTTTVQRCIFHGHPRPDGLFTDDRVFLDLVARDAAGLADQFREDPQTGELLAETTSWRPAVGYLAEVASTGAAVAHLPGATEPVSSPFGGGWPGRVGTGLRVLAGDAAPATSTRTDAPGVTCYVPKGITRTIEVSSLVDPELFQHWGFFGRAGRSDREELAPIIGAGRHWMVSARATLTLVHAVRRPLALVTAKGGLTADRLEVDDRRVSITGQLTLDVKSTDRITLIAAWTDPIDDRGSETGVVLVSSTRVLLEQRVEYAEDTARTLDATPVDAGDTKRHQATVVLEGFSRYARHFAERATIQGAAGAPVSFHDGPVVEGVHEVSTVDGRHLVVGRDVRIDARSGNIIILDQDLEGQMLRVDYIPLPVSRRSDEAGDGSGTWQVTIPNSGVPDGVGVHEVVPAFARTSTSDDDVRTVEHRGNVIRVWLDRPWFTTGEGELLGVVVDPASNGSESLHSRVARDPLSPSSPIAALGAGSFPRATVTRTNVDGTGLLVAGHPVHFDAERQRWFADVELAGDLGYRPFVQLSVGRFQPVSIEGAHLGPTIVTEAVRVGATRTVTVARNRDDATITVSGRAPRNLVTAVWQRRDDRIGDPDLGWSDIGEPVELVAGSRGPERSATMRLPISEGTHRLLVVDAELLTRQDGDAAVETAVTTYVETIDLPEDWRAEVVVPEVTGLEATPGDGAVSLVWDAVADSPDGLDVSYVAEHRVRGAEEWSVREGLPDPSTVIDGLENGTVHEFRVAARYGEVQGPWTPTVTGTPTAPSTGPTAPPGAIVGLVAEGGDQRIVLTWTIPDGDPEEYQIEISSGDRGRLRWERAVLDTDSDDDAITDNGNGTASSVVTGLAVSGDLDNGEPYRLRMRAINSAGDGPWSDTVIGSPVDPPDGGGDDPAPVTPGQVTGLEAAGIDQAVELSWTIPTGDITGYEVEIAPGDRGRLRWESATLAGDGVAGIGGAIGSPASVTVTGLADGTDLTNGEPCRFQVRAVRTGVDGSVLDAGPWSDTVVGTPEGAPPPAPPGQVTSLTGTPGDVGEVVLSWSAPAPGSGGTPTSYEAQRAPGERGRAVWDEVGTVEADEFETLDITLTVAGLDPADRSRYRVRAANAGGLGPWSDAIVATAGS